MARGGRQKEEGKEGEGSEMKGGRGRNMWRGEGDDEEWGRNEEDAD